MKLLFRSSVAALALAAGSIAFAQQGPVQIVGLMELSGTGATAGTNFDNGVKLAVKEINAAGGILDARSSTRRWTRNQRRRPPRRWHRRPSIRARTWSWVP